MDNKSDSPFKKSTDDLTSELNGHINIADFLKKNEKNFVTPDTGGLISGILKKKKITKSELASRSGMSEVYLYQILNGRRTPSRDRMICICLGLGCSMEETQDLLKQGCFAMLYPRVKRDAVIMFALEEHWDINRLNDELFDIEEETMF